MARNILRQHDSLLSKIIIPIPSLRGSPSFWHYINSIPVTGILTSRAFPSEKASQLWDPSASSKQPVLAPSRHHNCLKQINFKTGWPKNFCPCHNSCFLSFLFSFNLFGHPSNLNKILKITNPLAPFCSGWISS